MVVEIRGVVTIEKIIMAIALIFKDKFRKDLTKHFGKLSRGLNFVDYQHNVCNK